MLKLNLYELNKYYSFQNTPIFSARELVVIFDSNKRAVNGFLSYNVSKGRIIRLKAGLFTLANIAVNDFTIANKLYFPSYISLDTALSYYNLIPETVYSITSVTSKSTKEFETMNKRFAYFKIKKDAFLGYGPVMLEGEIVYIAHSEKAVADMLYLNFLKKREYNDRMDWSKINLNKLKSYLKLFSKKGLINYSMSKFKEYDQ
ncbi:MAG: hypothetical protein UR39_C0012G0003 [Candidatus Woesebacteria bacterium GW2011_GWA1_33_30]|uniref:Transcriptional regulator, AbiEi antitoxin, Type IV TA system n=1 Tax=Candidatus Woesebacteria bacterium GW2011_GWA2_33_28 TaxID=1618561 RepID=A0A0G0A537_9BACT|nr:MAG: hypothetical protein UR38_C0012G0003 [Candidatus Woesebacteria bacterium GW2011_GWA2_33_28]KKP46922.1 MAG: hypothetical protein UR39_C0012G0003 [Candidatus Woesebacteria bacterium GW2011_GWA1_33_30]KKP48652.1 MAG: hypothetical protein UR40_C0013G0003 [Microgenomates group bacterium GW2011_GWC1_33_32]KKP51341.1 MAG: hypothetical protein UR44_C0012G0003 [Candidatus Woesebacteria bacterium GW2011_GWB1_33_38]